MKRIISEKSIVHNFDKFVEIGTISVVQFNDNGSRKCTCGVNNPFTLITEILIAQNSGRKFLIVTVFSLPNYSGNDMKDTSAYELYSKYKLEIPSYGYFIR